METRATGRSKRQTLFILTIGGGLAFWATNFATSLLPIAAEYRAALSIAYVPMVLVESLLGGMIVGCCVSYFLIRFFDRIPTEDPIAKAEILSVVALVIATVVIQGAASLWVNDGLHYFLIGAMLNVPRFLILGTAVGYLYKRLNGSA
jgi:NhaP-type Na+/H+ or K+/H+ antiporter